MNLFQVFSTSTEQAAQQQRLTFCPHCGVPFEDALLAKGHRQRCGHCGYVHYLNPTPGIAMLIQSAEGRILIGKRRATARYGGKCGKWCLPGGYIEFEESFLETAHREVREETGLEVRIAGIVNVVSNHLDDLHHTLVIVLLGEPAGGVPRAGDDLTELRWIDREAHRQIDYAFEADQRIIDGYFTGHLQLLPVDARMEPG